MLVGISRDGTGVYVHDVALFVLVVAQTEEYYVALVDPDLLA
jgi:hypothetical protein